MSGSGGGGPGVVERASKEISRRIHSLGFKSSSSKRAKSVDTSDRGGAAAGTGNGPGSGSSGGDAATGGAAAKTDVISASTAAAVDKLNGNEGAPDGSPVGPAASPAPAPMSSASKMGTIIKGSVMDKVTHVFGSSSSSSGMGNSNSKDKDKDKNAAAAAAAAAVAAGSTGGSDSDSAAAGSDGKSANGINIPKGKQVKSATARFFCEFHILGKDPLARKIVHWASFNGVKFAMTIFSLKKVRS